MGSPVLTNAQRQLIRKAGVRKAEGYFIAEGKKVVDELMLAGWKAELICHLPELNGQYEQKAPAFTISERAMKSLTRLKSGSPVLALFREPPPGPAEGFKGNLLLLDRISDPGNLGTIIRTADWFGFGGIVLSPGCVDPYNTKTIQATMGSITRVKLWWQSLERIIPVLKKEEYSVYGAVLKGENLYKSNFGNPVALLLGSESHGIDPALLTGDVKSITIPAAGGAESLNVAVATGVFCAEIYRQHVQRG